MRIRAKVLGTTYTSLEWGIWAIQVTEITNNIELVASHTYALQFQALRVGFEWILALFGGGSEVK